MTSPGLGMEAMRKRGNNEDEGGPQEKSTTLIMKFVSVSTSNGVIAKTNIHTIAPTHRLKETRSFKDDSIYRACHTSTHSPYIALCQRRSRIVSTLDLKALRD